MTTINSELERLRAASPLDRAGIFKGICTSFSSGVIAKAIVEGVPRPKRTPVDRAGREIKPGVAVKDRKKPKGV
jgi:hypothetical protein